MSIIRTEDIRELRDLLTNKMGYALYFKSVPLDKTLEEYRNLINLLGVYDNTKVLSNILVYIEDTKVTVYCADKSDNNPNIVTFKANSFSENPKLRDFGMKSIDTSNLDFSQLDNLDFMFSDCRNLENLNLAYDINGIDNIRGIDSICAGCTSLKHIKFKDGALENIETAAEAFSACTRLIDIGGINCSFRNLKEARSMFYGCSNLLDIDLGNIESRNMFNISYMFCGCEKLERVDLHSLVGENLGTIRSMFEECMNIKEIDIRNLRLDNLKYMDGAFSLCCNLKKIHFSKSKAYNVESLDSLFDNCRSLENIDLDWMEDIKPLSMNFIFSNCEKLKKLDLSKVKFDIVDGVRGMFKGCRELEYIDLGEFNIRLVESLRECFCDCENLLEIHIDNRRKHEISALADVDYCFRRCKKLKKLDFSNFNLKLLKYAESTFDRCVNLEEIKFRPGTILTNISNLRDIFNEVDTTKINVINRLINKSTKLDVVKGGHKYDILFEV